jgi:hypothetical protein
VIVDYHNDLIKYFTHFGKFLFEICMRLHKGGRGEKRKKGDQVNNLKWIGTINHVSVL